MSGAQQGCGLRTADPSARCYSSGSQACFGIGCLPTISAFMQVLQRYFTPHSAAMAEYALANAVINRVKGQAKHPDEAHLSPIASLSSKEGEHGRLLCPL